MNKPLCLVISLSTGTLLLLACDPDVSRTQKQEAPAGSRHAIHSEQLRSIMAGMDEQARETWPQEIAGLKRQQDAQDSPERFERIASTAGRLAGTAHTIPQAVPESVLAGAQRQEFMKLVAQLESQARGVEKQAQTRNRSATDSALKQMRETCTACHQRFREVTGPL